MIRHALAVGALALLASCGPASDDGDAPGAPVDPAQLPAPDLAAGERPPAFAQCAVCHSVEPGKTGIGPSLAGVYGARAAHVGDFAYSPAMRQSGLVWDEPTLDRYLAAPLQVVPGTKMSYAGLRDASQRQAVIAYLKTL